jgi:hypothetical protein
MSAYDELNAAYQAALEELERARDAADADPSNEDLAARSDQVYDEAQVAYANLLASMDSPAPAADPAQGAVSSGAYLPAAAAGPPVPTEYVPSSTPPQGVEQYGSPSPTAHPAFGTTLSQASPVGVILTRPTPTTRFTPSETSLDDLVPIQRGLLAASSADRKADLGRNRSIAGSLPTWSPLPPGEIIAPGRKR